MREQYVAQSGSYYWVRSQSRQLGCPLWQFLHQRKVVCSQTATYQLPETPRGSFAVQSWTKDKIECQILLKMDNVLAVGYINHLQGTCFRILAILPKNFWYFCLNNHISVMPEYLPGPSNWMVDWHSWHELVETEGRRPKLNIRTIRLLHSWSRHREVGSPTTQVVQFKTEPKGSHYGCLSTGLEQRAERCHFLILNDNAGIGAGEEAASRISACDPSMDSSSLVSVSDGIFLGFSNQTSPSPRSPPGYIREPPWPENRRHCLYRHGGLQGKMESPSTFIPHSITPMQGLSRQSK